MYVAWDNVVLALLPLPHCPLSLFPVVDIAVRGQKAGVDTGRLLSNTLLAASHTAVHQRPLLAALVSPGPVNVALSPRSLPSKLLIQCEVRRLASPDLSVVRPLSTSAPPSPSLSINPVGSTRNGQPTVASVETFHAHKVLSIITLSPSSHCRSTSAHCHQQQHPMHTEPRPSAHIYKTRQLGVKFPQHRPRQQPQLPLPTP
jgi:hypothetical protein